MSSNKRGPGLIVYRKEDVAQSCKARGRGQNEKVEESKDTGNPRPPSSSYLTVLALVIPLIVDVRYKILPISDQSEQPTKITALPSGIDSGNARLIERMVPNTPRTQFWTSAVASGVEYGSIRWNQSPSFQVHLLYR